jgi:hypothetical protein
VLDGARLPSEAVCLVRGEGALVVSVAKDDSRVGIEAFMSFASCPVAADRPTRGGCFDEEASAGGRDLRGAPDTSATLSFWKNFGRFEDIADVRCDLETRSRPCQPEAPSFR